MTNAVTQTQEVVMIASGRWARAMCIVGALFLGGCASGATAQGMTVRSGDVKGPPSADVANALSIEDVTGGDKTSPMWMSNIASDDFKAALLASMKSAGLLAESTPARYKVRVSLLKLDQPLFGVDMTVTSTVRYVIVDAQTGVTLFDETVVAPHTARVGDAFVGTTRLRLANEGAARKSIASFIEKVNTAKLPQRRSTGGTASL